MQITTTAGKVLYLVKAQFHGIKVLRKNGAGSPMLWTPFSRAGRGSIVYILSLDNIHSMTLMNIETHSHLLTVSLRVLRSAGGNEDFLGGRDLLLSNVSKAGCSRKERPTYCNVFNKPEGVI